MWPAMAVGFGLFLGGAVFAYYWVLPRALLFFYEWSGDMGISNDWRIGEYISFATQFTLLFGLSFELPVVVMVFVKLGLLSYETMSKTRSYAIVAIFVAAAILTPTPDVFTLLLMAAADDHPLRNLHLARLVRPQEKPHPGGTGSPRTQERQLLREEQMRAEEQSAARPPPKTATGIDESSGTRPITSHEAGDDGWHEEYPQQDHHASR